jgi:hypothetical protein
MGQGAAGLAGAANGGRQMTNFLFAMGGIVVICGAIALGFYIVLKVFSLLPETVQIVIGVALVIALIFWTGGGHRYQDDLYCYQQNC